MHVTPLIEKTRDGVPLTDEEIHSLVQGFVAGDVPDYQMSAWLMAACIRGLSPGETAALTRAMVTSGETIDLSPVGRPVVDKHSTGGVGDKISLVAAPLVAAAGVPVGKMSGRGLAHSGGTIDKLEAIPGLRTELAAEAFVRQVERIGLAIAAQTEGLVPADKSMYALRDVTGSVPGAGLIASSIMSKKIAGGAAAIVLDVKCGAGAFARTLDAAVDLADLMVSIGAASGRPTQAVISDMDEPLGAAVGNACEVREAIETLAGEGPADVRELALEIAARMIRAGGAAATVRDARALAEAALRSGRGLRKLTEMIQAQGGDPCVVDDPGRLPRARIELMVRAETTGIVQRVDALDVGRAAMRAGAGREAKGQRIDPGAGVVLAARRGDRVAMGAPLATVFASNGARAEDAARVLRSAYRMGEAPPRARTLILKEVPARSG